MRKLLNNLFIRRVNLIFNACIFVWICLMFYRCQDVIPVDLNSANPQIVIEGEVSNKSDTVKVWISKTTDYFNPAPNTYVTNAEVNISDNHGNVFPLAYSSEGFYYIQNITGVEGDTYTLKVKTDSADYEAASKMPVLVSIDSLAFQSKTDVRNENAIICYFKDPPGISNYYQIKIYRRKVLLNKDNRLMVYSDKYFDGRYNSFTLDSRRFVDSTFKAKDTLTVQLLNIDKQTYEYYTILRNITNTGRLLSSSTPGNPPNNINNGALGYFAAKSISEKKIVIR
jgi:hypothetical protein